MSSCGSARYPPRHLLSPQPSVAAESAPASRPPRRGRGVFAKRHRAWARGERGSGWRHCPLGAARASLSCHFPHTLHSRDPAALISSGGCCLGCYLALRSFECVGDGTPPRRAIPPCFRTARRSCGAATLWAKRACSVWHERSIAWPLSSQGLTKQPPLSFGVARAVAVPRTGASSYSYPDGTAAVRLIVVLDLHHPSTLGARLTVVTPLPRSSSRRRRASRYAAGSTRRRRRSNGM